jgi:lipopolysaccharide/colanic/teichoic acid biosynthesis glycosyltransferase
MPRAFDFFFALAALLLLSPLLLVLALLVRLTSPGPVLHRGLRIGREGVPFAVYKFRTMIPGAAQVGPGITRSGDSRITSVGRFLRRTKLDELPQLFNVLKGEMSLVGPRPEDPRYVAVYTSEQRRLLSVRPGITSAASIRFRHEERLLAGASDWERTYMETVLPEKLRIDMNYLETRSFITDLRLLGETALALFR